MKRLFFVCLLIVSTSIYAQYEYFGPHTATVYQLFVSDTLVFLFGSDGRLYRNTLNGSEWTIDTSFNFGEKFLAGRNDTIIYIDADTPFENIVMSIDKGKSWEKIYKIPIDFRSSFEQFEPKSLCLGNQKILYVTSYETVNNSPAWLRFYLVDLETKTTKGIISFDWEFNFPKVYFSTHIFQYFFVVYTNGYIYDIRRYLLRILNDGSQYSVTLTTGYEINFLYPIGNNILMGTQKGLKISSDSGATWKDFGLDTLNVLSIGNLGNTIFAGTEKNGLFASTDNGKTWVSCNEGLMSQKIGYIEIVEGKVVVGTNNGVYISSDTGKTWTPKNKGLNNAWVINCLVPKGDEVFVGTRGQGFFYSSNRGKDWQPRDRNLTSYDVRAIQMKGDSLLIVTNGGGFYYSTNKGEDWIPRNQGLTTLNLTSLLVVGDTFYVGAWPGGVFQSMNSGKTWKLKNNGTFSVSVLFQLNNFIYAGSNSGLYRSNSDSASWRKILDCPLVCSFLVPNERLSLVGSQWGLYSSEDGEKWKLLAFPNYKIQSITLLDSVILVVCRDPTYTYPSLVFLSFDMGSSWQFREGLIPGRPIIEFISNYKNKILINNRDNGLLAFDLAQLPNLPRISHIPDVQILESSSKEIEFTVKCNNPDSLVFSVGSLNKNLIPGSSLKVLKKGEKFVLQIKPSLGLNGETYVELVVKEGNNIAKTLFKITVEKAKMEVLNLPQSIKIKENQVYQSNIFVYHYEPKSLKFTFNSSNTSLLPQTNVRISQKDDTTFTLTIEPKIRMYGQSDVFFSIFDQDDTLSFYVNFVVENAVPVIQNIPAIVMYANTEYKLELYYDYPKFEMLEFKFVDPQKIFGGISIRTEKLNDSKFLLYLKPRVNRWGLTTIKMTVTDSNDTIVQYFDVLVLGTNSVDTTYEEQLRIYPNPVDDVLEIFVPRTMALSDNESSRIQIYNVFGETMKNFVLYSPSYVLGKIKLNVASFPPSYYLLKIGNYTVPFIKR